MKLTAVIDSMDEIKDQPWQGPKGPVWFTQGHFRDGSVFSIGSASIEKAREKHAELSLLIDKTSDFEVEQRGEYNGKPKYKVLDWPGKPENPTGYGGFGRSAGGAGQRAPYQVRYRDTEEGFAREQRSIHRSVALQHAVAWLPRVGDITSGDVLDVASVFYGWLSQDAPPAAPPALAAAPGQPVESKHPALDELKQRFSLQTADQMPTAREKYIEVINECVKTKNHERLKKLPELIVQSCEANTVSLDEAEELERHLSAAKKALSSAAEYDRWHADRLTEAQDRMPKSF